MACNRCPQRGNKWSHTQFPCVGKLPCLIDQTWNGCSWLVEVVTLLDLLSVLQSMNDFESLPDLCSFILSRNAKGSSTSKGLRLLLTYNYYTTLLQVLPLLLQGVNNQISIHYYCWWWCCCWCCCCRFFLLLLRLFLSLLLLGFLFLFNTLFILCGKFGLPYPGKATRPQEQRYPVLPVHAGSLHVSIIHRTLTWTTWSFTCERDHYCASTRGLTHRQRVSIIYLTRKNF